MTRDPLEDLLGHVDEHVVAMTAEVAMLRHELSRETEERERSTRWLWGALAVIVAVIVVGAVVIVSNRQLARETHDLNRHVVECTTPSPEPGDAIDDEDVVHECWDRLITRSPTSGP